MSDNSALSHEYNVALESFVEQLQKDTNILAAFVYGSMVCGDVWEASDIDMLIVTKDDHGNTVLVIEHQMDVIKSAAYVIDLGPSGGDEGGEIVAIGTPEEVAQVDASFTGQYLKNLITKGGK
ncbi:MAG: nucleotidyltransferase domain-containing protein [Candidatus Thorarchaeota archaeon]|nr:nucleotidyltransferase domain-containing protein [Candidatus Thorarchaeota archaeon]